MLIHEKDGQHSDFSIIVKKIQSMMENIQLSRPLVSTCVNCIVGTCLSFDPHKINLGVGGVVIIVKARLGPPK